MSEDGAGFEEVVVRRAGDLGVDSESEPPTIRGPGDHGWGDDLKTPAWNEVREKIDPADYDAKTHVATIHYDLDAWEFTIEFFVEVDREA
ncbi:hypothetical protein CP556_25110 [Natrinema sp. CBA1119]|uniref:hypothetical protein n=1 Tax=Natrinema sp. CBA1119 TaxID=1608465 RepID=UPI000BF618A7|nr:hypothetical protein [Natrinema sp. CBA1119]PGF13810.1 hypothetical protein CP556_25110 [Natrinema sp. CBA1119]